MKLKPLLISMLIIFLSINTCTAFAADDNNDTSMLVVFKDNVSESRQDSVINNEDLEVLDEMSNVDSIKEVQIPNEMTYEEISKELEDNKYVDYVQPNFQYELAETTNDPYVKNTLTNSNSMYNFQWHLLFTNITNSLTSAWDYSTGKGVNVCVADSGIPSDNPDLVYNEESANANVKKVYNATNGETTIESVDDSNGHGTHVAGIIGAKGNNSKLGAGVAYDSNIYVAKIIDDEGYILSSYLLKAMAWAEENNCRVINFSLGSKMFDSNDEYNDEDDPALADAIKNAYLKDTNSMLTVCAAGNGATAATSPKYSPSDFDYAYSVTNLEYDSSGKAGINSGSQHNEYKDIAAPGTRILSLNSFDNSKLIEKSGTSMAAPFVSGTAALLLEIDPTLSAADIENILNKTATDLGTAGRDDYYGNGEINPLKAVIEITKNLSPVEIKSFSCSPEKIRATGYKVYMNLSLSEIAEVTIKVVNCDTGKTVKTLIKDKIVQRNIVNQYTWNLIKDNGKIAELGKYKIIVSAKNNSGNDESIKTVKLINKAPKIAIKNKLKRTYTYTKPAGIKIKTNTIAKVKLVIYNKKGKAIKTLNNSRLKKGTYVFKWNGRNSSGKKMPRGYYRFSAKIKNENGYMKIKSKYFYLKK